MAALSDLAADIIADIPEIPIFIANRQILRAARELCEESRCWRYDVTLNTVADQATYNLASLFTPEVNVQLVDVISMKPTDGSTPVKPITKGWLDINWADWRDDTALTATYYTLESNNTIRLIPTPSQTVSGAYTIRIAVKPRLSATTIDDVVYNKFYELLVSGAKANLFMVPRKPWTDLQMAQYHRATFLGGFPAAVAEAQDDFQTGVARKVKYGGL
jgi:hypothetical protein